jgi:hypothetical protein
MQLVHHVSSLSTDCPDESTEGVGSPSNVDENQDDSSSEGESSMSDE